MSEASEASGFEANESEASETTTKTKGPRFQVEFTDYGQATGQYRAKYATIVGQVARTHCPPMYKDWAEVPDLTKDALWKKVLVEIDLPLIRKECTLRKLNTAWKQKKYELRQVYDKFPTDAERKRNVPSKVKKEEWEAFVDMCSTEEDKTKRFNGKLAREQMKNPHTTGRMGAVPVIEQLKKNSPTGEVSRTEGYVAIYTRRDGSCINFETKQSLEEIDRLVSNEPNIVERDLDNDPIALVIGRDGRGRVRGLGSGVTKTVYHALAPYKEIAQREKRARENSESGYEAIMARLDEADKARKILEDEVADLKRQSSGLGNASQEIQQSPVQDDSRNIRPQSTTCHLKSFITKTVVALGEVCTYLTTLPSSYNVRIDEILDDFAPLYEGDGRLGDIVLGDVITWPKNYVVFH